MTASNSNPPSSRAIPGEQATFEQAVRRLSEIVQMLEKGDLPLEESVALFEEGVKLSLLSQQRLDAAERKVEELLQVDESGRPRTVPFQTRQE